MPSLQLKLVDDETRFATFSIAPPDAPVRSVVAETII
jgi:hypothetical protein